MKLFLFLCSLAVATHAETTFKAKEAWVKGRIFMYLQDGKDEATLIQAKAGVLYIFPSANSTNKLSASGNSITGDFQIDVMHKTEIETFSTATPIGPFQVAFFYVNANTTLSYEAENGEVFIQQGGHGRVKINREGGVGGLQDDGARLGVTIDGNVTFADKMSIDNKQLRETNTFSESIVD